MLSGLQLNSLLPPGADICGMYWSWQMDGYFCYYVVIFPSFLEIIYRWAVTLWRYFRLLSGVWGWIQKASMRRAKNTYHCICCWCRVTRRKFEQSLNSQYWTQSERKPKRWVGTSKCILCVIVRACLDHLAKRSMIVTSSTADRDHWSRSPAPPSESQMCICCTV